jgi:DNA-directed RNA polymerase specialized sigma24 family protein
MSVSDETGSVSHWIGHLKTGDQDAARLLWERYFAGLVEFARGRLRQSSRRAADEEDVALSAFHSLCHGAALGRFPQLDDRDNLWRLLVTMTAQKAVDHRRREGRLKRGGGRRRVEPGPDGGERVWEALAQVAGLEPSPEFAAMMAEQYVQLLDRLEDETLRRLATWKLEGYSNAEIAERLSCGLRTVERKLGVIRATWLADERP